MLRVQIRRDEEAGVYVAYSPDLDGLVVEAKTLDDLRAEALGAAEALLELAVDGKKPPRSMTDFRLLDSAHCPA